uniref:Ig-like domain-containing protein n=1 Tax=Clastoptera arizonana TaxID=38151 RepID=A0A1B6E6D7_9HEMI
MMSRCLLLLAASTCFLLFPTQGNALQKYKGVDLLPQSGLVGETIQLRCDVNTKKCGDLHSIKWYRGSSRIYVFSELANITKPEGDYTKRAKLQYTPNSTAAFLTVEGLQVADEATYKCEITYLEVRDDCKVVQFIHLTTLIKPESVTMYKRVGTNDSKLTNATSIGPLTEDDELELMCESRGGKPIPMVQWYNGTDKMNDKYESESSGNGIGTGRSSVRVTVGRGDLGAKYQCRVTNDALVVPLVTWVELDVNVRPLSLNLTGVEHHVVQGTKVLLQCSVTGARPAANITWYNGTNPIPTRTNSTMQDDGTYNTESHLIFTASRWENGHSLSCEATNLVMQMRNEWPMRADLKLEVMFPPLVEIVPDAIVLNETEEISLYCFFVANPTNAKPPKWFRDDVELIPVDYLHSSEEVASDNTSLKIRNASRHDQGMYTCMVENEVGVGKSTNFANVTVYYKPTVNLTTYPVTPVTELANENITLFCEVESGNPSTLQAVRWFYGDELLKEIPDCSNDTFCGLDPSKLLLENVDRRFHGNYSCIGMNEAGWGKRSADTEVIVYYPPGPAKLTYSPSKVIKGGSVTLTCSVEDPGRPNRIEYVWKRGSRVYSVVKTDSWLISPVSLETESNFSCSAKNDGGESESSTVNIQVLAKPKFIRTPEYYTGGRFDLEHINISCRVECSPMCAIHWLKNDRLIDLGPNSLYYVQDVTMAPDIATNDFQSVYSMLIWNMSAWPGQQLDRIRDNDYYTCRSTGNEAGPGVNFTTKFAVEYPPENLTVSKAVVNVIEGQIPDKVTCLAQAHPEASFRWFREGDEDPMKKNNVLDLDYAMPRKNGGRYVCEAFNEHGRRTIATRINVLYKPECGITQTEQGGKLVLECTVVANPQDVDFTWKIKNENETLEENIVKDGLRSFLTLETRVENFRTYLCFANNSVGMSIACERDVTGHVGWWMKLENESLIIIIAIVAGTIVVAIIICIIIIIVCRRKRAADKCPNPSATKDKSDLNSSPSDALLHPDPDNRAFYENLPFHGMQNPPNKNSHCKLTSTQLDCQHLLLNTSSIERQSLKKPKHCIRERDEYYNTHYPAQPPPPPPYMMKNGAVVYADLALNQKRTRQPLPHPQHVPIPLYHPSKAQTEYAVIKFHDVGQEIDV